MESEKVRITLADLRGLEGNGERLRCPVCRRWTEELVLMSNVAAPMCQKCAKARQAAAMPIRKKLL